MNITTRTSCVIQYTFQLINDIWIRLLSHYMCRFYLHEVTKYFLGVPFYGAAFMSSKIIQPQTLCINHGWMIAN